MTTQQTEWLTAEQIAAGWKTDTLAMDDIEAGTVIEVVTPQGECRSGYVDDFAMVPVTRYRTFSPDRPTPDFFAENANNSPSPTKPEGLEWQEPTSWSLETTDGMFYAEKSGAEWVIYKKGRIIGSAPTTSLVKHLALSWPSPVSDASDTVSDDLTEKQAIRISTSLASMIAEYVEGGIHSDQNWKAGLDHIIAARLKRLWPMRDTVAYESLPDSDKDAIDRLRASLNGGADV